MTDLDADPAVLPRAIPQKCQDAEAVARVCAGDVAAFELLMRRYNQRLFRLARSVLRDENEAEDVVQETYLRAYEALPRFEGRAQFSTWISRIAFHEALARLRRRNRTELVDFADSERIDMHPHSTELPAEQLASAKELAALLTLAVDRLPIDLRTAFTLRLVEGLDTNETAASLDLTPANVKVRVHRARAMLRDYIDRQIGEGVRELYQFGGQRCDRIVSTVLTRLSPPEPLPRHDA